MNRAARVYLISVSMLGCIAVAGAHSWALLPELQGPQPLALVALITLGIFSEALGVQFAIGAANIASAISFIPFFTAILILPPPYQLVVPGVVFAVAQTVIHKKSALRAMFNVSQVVLSVLLATLVYQSLGGVPGDARSLEILNYTGLAITFFFINQLLVTLAITLLSGGKFSPTFIRILSASGSNLFYDLLVSPIAVVVALLYLQIQVGGIFLVFFPMLLVRHAYANIQRLQRANKDVLHVLIKTIETRDPYTSGHSVRVSQLAKVIAEDLELSPFKVDEIEMAALVHDIGKIDSIYTDLIRKESSLTDAERRIIMTHAAKGAEFLRTLSSFPESVILSVRHHHERYDGTGYPDRIKGEEIPLPARIIMLCDSIDAMLSDRPYRDALTADQVRAELLRCAGTQFDPTIVQVILKRDTLAKAIQLVGPAARKKPALSVAV